MKMYFKADTHQYFNEKNEEYKSVSYIAKLLDRKDEAFWERKKKTKAKKLGISVDDLTKEWDRKKILGTQAGTFLHGEKEEEIINNDFSYMNVVCKKKMCTTEGDLKWSIPIVNLDDNTVYPELMIYDHEYKVCGQADKVVIINNTIFLEDFKSDRSIDRKAFGSDFSRSSDNKLKPPVAHLDDCNYNVYSLKMSLYMYMLWRANKHLKIGKLILEHLTIARDSEGVPILTNGRPTVLKTERIEVPYLRKEVRDILKAYKEGAL